MKGGERSWEIKEFSGLKKAAPNMGLGAFYSII